MFNNKFIFFLLFFFTLTIHAQQITGVVVDSVGNKVSLALVQLSKDSKIISSGQTNVEGKFTLDTQNNTFPFQLKVNHIRYQSKTVEVHTDGIKIILSNRVTSLEQLVINKELDIKRKKDTLAYNLAKLLNGSEVMLRNVIEKLPGLTISENNKILFNGKQINHILLDGDKFYGSNHQLALDNITSEMIEKIEMLTKFKDLSHLEGTDPGNVSALNISLKDKYKLKLKGNLETDAGLINRYKIHNNLYNFNKGFKFNLVTNTNNTNTQVISVSDYLNIRNATGSQVFNEGFTGGIYSETTKLPSFMSGTDDSKSRNIQNATLNFTKSFEANKRLEIQSILNKIDQKDITLIKQEFLGTDVSSFQNQNNINGISTYWSTLLEFENKWTPRNYYKLNAYVLVSDDQQNALTTSIINQVNFTNNLKLFDGLKTTNVGVSSTFKNKISDKIVFSSGFYADFIQNKNNKTIFSSEPLTWFNVSDSTAIQNSTSNKVDFGVMTSTNLRTFIGPINFRYLSQLNTEAINNTSNLTDFLFTTRFYQSSHNLSFRYNTNFKYNIQLHLKGRYALHQVNVPGQFNKTVQAFLPSITTIIPILKHTNLALGYEENIDSFNTSQFITGNQLLNYRMFTTASTLSPQLLKTQIINSNLNYSNPNKSLFANMSFSYVHKDKTISYVSVATDLVTAQSLTYIDGNTNQTLSFNASKKFENLPFSLDFRVNQSQNNQNIFINSQLNKLENNSLFFDLKSISYFKKSLFNFKYGVEYNLISSLNTTTNYSSDLKRFTPNVTLNGAVFNNKVNWELRNNYHNFKSSQFNNRPIYDLGFKFIYAPNPTYNFYVTGNNIFNIKENNYKNQFISSDFYTQQILTNTLSGFINVGFKINY